MTTVGALRARAVLGAHGIDPDADADALVAALAARGGCVRLEEIEGRGRGWPPRWSGRAARAAPPGSRVADRPRHVMVRGADGRAVLARILAKVLEKERKERWS